MCIELQALLGPVLPGQTIQAVPGADPMFRCGFSDRACSARISPRCWGLPYAFASHFAPDALYQALEVYRTRFEPSAQLDKPYAMAGVNVIVAETDAEATRLFTSIQQRFTDMFRKDRGYLKPPIDDIETYWTPTEKLQASRMLGCSFVGSPKTVESGLKEFIAKTGVDELMVSSAIYDHAARLRSYELLASLELT